MAEVVEDVIDDDTLDILRASTDELVRSSGVPSPGSLSELMGAGRVVGWSVWVAPILVVVALGLWVSLGLGFGILALAVAAIGVAWRRFDSRRQ